mmetsp:Transcript_51111/g.128279  ORF Transcript_51111/g.128279 Transcript_51111/m.128279 type:complete len:221 (-) Transcript_51111:551-1213(-)
MCLRPLRSFANHRPPTHLYTHGHSLAQGSACETHHGRLKTVDSPSRHRGQVVERQSPLPIKHSASGSTRKTHQPSATHQNDSPSEGEGGKSVRRTIPQPVSTQPAVCTNDSLALSLSSVATQPNERRQETLDSLGVSCPHECGCSPCLMLSPHTTSATPARIGSTKDMYYQDLSHRQQSHRASMGQTRRDDHAVASAAAVVKGRGEIASCRQAGRPSLVR